MFVSVKLSFIESVLRNDVIGDNVPANLDVLRQQLLNRRVTLDDDGLNRLIDETREAAFAADRAAQLAKRSTNNNNNNNGSSTTTTTREPNADSSVVEVHLLHPKSVGEVEPFLSSSLFIVFFLNPFTITNSSMLLC